MELIVATHDVEFPLVFQIALKSDRKYFCLYSNSLRSNEYKEFIFNSGENQGQQTGLAAEVSSGQSQRFYKVSSIKYTIS